MQNEAIQTLVTDLLAALGAQVDAISVSGGTRTVVAVTSPDGTILIGENGDTLKALNTIARRLYEARSQSAEESAAAFLIDVNGYHEGKLEELRTTAKQLAERARLFKHEVEMPPMSSYERLVIHELFADDAEIETVSTGEGKFRHIVLKYVPPATSI